MKSLVIFSEGFARCFKEYCTISAVPCMQEKINSQVSKIRIMMRQKSESDAGGRGKRCRLKPSLDSC